MNEKKMDLIVFTWIAAAILVLLMAATFAVADLVFGWRA